MDNDRFWQLLNINCELIEICRSLEDQQTLESLVPITGKLTRLVLELSVSPMREL